MDDNDVLKTIKGRATDEDFVRKLNRRGKLTRYELDDLMMQ